MAATIPPPTGERSKPGGFRLQNAMGLQDDKAKYNTVMARPITKTGASHQADRELLMQRVVRSAIENAALDHHTKYKDIEPGKLAQIIAQVHALLRAMMNISSHVPCSVNLEVRIEWPEIDTYVAQWPIKHFTKQYLTHKRKAWRRAYNEPGTMADDDDDSEGGGNGQDNRSGPVQRAGDDKRDEGDDHVDELEDQDDGGDVDINFSDAEDRNVVNVNLPKSAAFKAASAPKTVKAPIRDSEPASGAVPATSSNSIFTHAAFTTQAASVDACNRLVDDQVQAINNSDLDWAVADASTVVGNATAAIATLNKANGRKKTAAAAPKAKIIGNIAPILAASTFSSTTATMARKRGGAGAKVLDVDASEASIKGVLPKYKSTWNTPATAVGVNEVPDV